MRTTRRAGLFAANPYDCDPDKKCANFQPLTPLTFLERSASVFPDRTAIIDGCVAGLTATSTPGRGVSRPRFLARRGIGCGDTVAVMLANTPPMLECHYGRAYGVPMTGAVLNALNTRLDPAIVALSRLITAKPRRSSLTAGFRE